MKKKILIFSITYFPYQGGAEVAVKEITDRLPGDNFEFDMITGSFDKNLPEQEKIGNVNVYRVGKNLKINSIVDKIFCVFKMWKVAFRLQREKHYDIVWSIMATWGGIATLFFKILNPQVKYLLTEQSGDSDLFIGVRTAWWRFIYKYVYRKADYIQVISNWLKDRVLKYGYKGEIAVVPNGVDLKKFAKPIGEELRIKNQELRSKLEISENHKIIFTTSRLVHKNGIEYLIRAFKLLITNYQLPITLLIAGDGKLDMKLKDLAYELGVYEQIRFLGDVPNTETPHYYHLADVFVRPSLSEGFGVSFVEAMAAEVPVIATPVGGIPDFLTDRETGLFCEVKNPESLSDKIKLILEDKNLRDNITLNALKMVTEKYNWEHISSQMGWIFNKL